MAVITKGDRDRVRAKLDALRRPEDIPTPLVVDPLQQYLDPGVVDPKLQALENANLDLLEAQIDKASPATLATKQAALDAAIAAAPKLEAEVATLDESEKAARGIP